MSGGWTRDCIECGVTFRGRDTSETCSSRCWTAYKTRGEKRLKTEGAPRREQVGGDHVAFSRGRLGIGASKS